MPIYEYQCKHCHHEFEVVQKMADEPITLCSQCHENSAVRLVSAAGFQLKGDGWYATDFKNKGAPPKKDAAVPAETKATTTAESTTTTPGGEKK